MIRNFTMNFVCFGCQASYSQTFLANVKAAARVCPVCQTPMVYVTPKYKSPKKADERAWEVDRLLVNAGLLAYSPRFADGVSPDLKVQSLKEARQLIEHKDPSYAQTLKTRKKVHKHWKAQGESP